MAAVIDIDIGGTFTDCLVTWDERMVWAKTPTTRYNLSVGFKRALTDAARELDLSLDQLVQQTTVIRYSTTIGMNTLIERSGPKLGLITTAGHEHAVLIGRARVWADGLPVQERRHVYRQRKPDPLIPFDMIVGVRERIDCFGQIVIPIQREDVREQVQYLVDRGVRGFVVCLLWSFLNPIHEQVVREVIEEEYPDIYLGNMPTILSSEVQAKWHEYPRANVAILTAYMQGDMSQQFSALGEDLRNYGYKRPLVISNNMGGMAKVSRTRAIDTYGAGPVAGLFGAGYISKIYGFPKVLVTDMGGTSFDFGVVEEGTPRSYQEWPVIDRWATERSMVEVRSIGGGGGSIASINEVMGNRLEVGPASAGSYPGPACYDQGGEHPTVTDADVVLGYINPDYFLGGKIRLNKKKALEAMQRIAKPLGLTVEESAAAICKIIEANTGDVILKELLLRGHDPRQFVLFAYGGAGPTHCAGYGGKMGITKIITFPFASVFCAWGGATMNLRQVYEATKHLVIYQPRRTDKYTPDFNEFNSVVNSLKEIALRDMRSEGFRPEEVMLSLELEMRYGGQNFYTRLLSPKLYVEDESDVAAVCDAFQKEYAKRYGEISAIPEAGIEVQNYYLLAEVPLTKPRLPQFELEGEDPEVAVKGTRPVYWEQFQCFKETTIFDADLLRPGNVVNGPAVVESRDTTYVVPPAMKYRIDEYRSGIFELGTGT